MGRFKFFQVLFVIFFIPLFISAKTPHESAKEMAEILTENLSKTPLELEVRNLLLEGTPITSEFADFYLELLIDRLKRNEEDFVLVKKRVVTEKKARTRGLSLKENFVSEDEEVMDASLSGSYRESGNKLFINIRIEGDGGESISYAESDVSLDSISLSYKPQETPEIKEESELLKNDIQSIRKDFKLQVELNKGNGAIYYHGDDFKVLVKPEHNSFIKILYRQINGDTVPIFESEIKIDSSMIQTLPPNDSDQWQIDCSSGCGTETVVVMASTKKFKAYDFNESNSWSLPQMIQTLQEAGVRRDSKLSVEYIHLTTTE